jgi:hypothetical protein
MLAALAGQISHPVVATFLGLGAAGVAGAVVAMAWNVYARQVQFAERLAGRPTASPGRALAGRGADRGGSADRGGADRGGADRGNGAQAAAEGAEPVNGTGAAAHVVIEGPDTLITGEPARYRVPPSGTRRVVSWAVGGGAVSQAPDAAHPGELVLTADRPGSLTIIVRVRDGMTERRGTKPVTAVADVTPAPPFSPRAFLNAWGLVAVAALIAGLAAALVALGTLASADFIALVAPLAAVLGVVAARGMGDAPGRRDKTALAGQSDEPFLPGRPRAAETSVQHQPVP